MTKMKLTYVKIYCVFAFCVAAAAMTLTGCKKFVDVNAPVTSTNSGNAFTSDATAAAVLTGVYTKISSSGFTHGGLPSLSLFPSLSSDELELMSGSANMDLIAYYRNALSSSNTMSTDFWSNIYPVIYMVNAAMDGLSGANSLTPAVRSQLMGEAKFIRAFCYFYLVNLYGDVPLVKGIDYTVNAGLPRTAKADVWNQVISDLKEAKSLLADNYVSSNAVNVTTERTRPNRWAAAALLARTYLYNGDWENAEKEADSVINHTVEFELIDDLDAVFLANSREAIWQLQPVNTGQNTQDAITFVLTSGPNNNLNPVFLSPFLFNAFKENDLRFSHWIGVDSSTGKKYYFPYKYKQAVFGQPVTEYLMVLRIAEQYLVRAEARVQQGEISGAASDLNAIRLRAGLSQTSATTRETLLTAIQNERQVELFTEWGHRWLDLKRTGMVNDVMTVVTPLKNGTWKPAWQWYPIQIEELQNDPALKQNEGY